MVERAILTAGIVVFVIGVLAAIGESAGKLSQSVNCSLENASGGGSCDSNAKTSRASSEESGFAGKRPNNN